MFCCEDMCFYLCMYSFPMNECLLFLDAEHLIIVSLFRLSLSVSPSHLPHLQAFSTCFFSFRDSSERNIPSRRTRLTLLQVSQVVKNSFNMRSSLYILICPHARPKGVCDKSYSSLLRALFFFNHFPN